MSPEYFVSLRDMKSIKTLAVVKVVAFCPPTQICITSGGEEERGTTIPGFIEEEW